MGIDRQCKNISLSGFSAALLFCLIIVFQPPIKYFPVQSVAWAGNPGWSDAFGGSSEKKSAFPLESGSAGGNWNTVIDNNSYNKPDDNYRNVGENNTQLKQSEVHTSETPQPAASVNQPGVLELIDTLLAANQPAEIPPTLYINNMTKAQYAGAVSMAMEGMRLFYGDMDEQQEGLFEASWLPLFRYPSEEIIFYVNHLNPLLLKFLSLRAALNDCIEDFNATQLSVMVCTEIGDALGVSQTMESAVIYALAGKTLNARLQLVGQEIIDLGEPPNAAGLMKKARQKHEDAFNEFSHEPPLSITPANLKAVPGREYTFKIKIADYEKYKNRNKLVLAGSCKGLDKIENGIVTVKKTFHKKIGSTENFTIQLHQYPGPKILGSVTSRITMVDNPGCWTLVDSHTYDTGRDSKYLTYTISEKECRIESAITPPSFKGTALRFAYRNTWTAPPQRISPKTAIKIQATIKRIHLCSKFSVHDRNSIAVAAGKYETKKDVDLLKSLADYNTSLLNCGIYENICAGCMPVDPPSMTMSWFTDSELSKQVESDPWTTGSLNKSVVQLQSGAPKAQVFLTQRVPNGIQEDHYNKDKPNLIFLHIQITNRFFYSKDYRCYNSGACSSMRAGVVYVYKWDPSGNQIAPLQIDSQGLADAPATPPETSMGKQEKAEKIIFHQHNIKYFTKNIKAIKKQIANIDKMNAKNEVDIREKLDRDLLYSQDALQREIDAVTTIQTGNFVHTRTALDAKNMDIMAKQSRSMEGEFHRKKRYRERVNRLIDQAPAAARKKLRKFYSRHVMAGNVSDEECEKAVKVIYKRVSGAIESEILAHEEDAQYWDENLKMAQDTKIGAEYAMMALSFTGASATYNLFAGARTITASGVYMSYSAVTGYIEGGLGEAVSRTLAAYNAGITIINAGMQGYQAGVLQNLEDYAQNPQKIDLDEEIAGFKGAAWSAGSAAAFAVAIKFGMKAYQNRSQSISDHSQNISDHSQNIRNRPQSIRNRPQSIKNKEAPFKLNFDEAKQNIRLRYFKRRTIAGAQKVKTFRKCDESFRRACQDNAPASKISELRNELDEAYKAIKTDYFAKKTMKFMEVSARGKTASSDMYKKTVSAYNSADRKFMEQLNVRLSERMEAAGFNRQQYRSFSNSASRGGIGMDVDLGAVEPPRCIITAGGRRISNPEHIVWRQNITRTVNGTTRKVSPYDLQKAGQQELEAAFHDIYGCRPGEAMVSYTTSYHPEAYRDPRWLGSRQCKTALVYQTDPKWTQQAADVTDFKINTMDAHNPSMGYYGKMQENCRGLVKDFNTKLEPLLRHSNNPTAVAHMRKLKQVMTQFSDNKIGPVKAEQILRILTGNRGGLREVSQRFKVMLQGLKAIVN